MSDTARYSVLPYLPTMGVQNMREIKRECRETVFVSGGQHAILAI